MTILRLAFLTFQRPDTTYVEGLCNCIHVAGVEPQDVRRRSRTPKTCMGSRPNLHADGVLVYAYIYAETLNHRDAMSRFFHERRMTGTIGVTLQINDEVTRSHLVTYLPHLPWYL